MNAVLSVAWHARHAIIFPGPISVADFLQRIAASQDIEIIPSLRSWREAPPDVPGRGCLYGERIQETPLTVWRKAGLYSGDKGNATTWIFAIARNLRIDRLRKEQTCIALADGYDQMAVLILMT